MDTSTTITLTDRIKRHALDLGFDLVGVTDVRASDHAGFLKQWLAAGRHGEMQYLAREDALEHRIDPAGSWPMLRSAVVVGQNYFADAGDGDGDNSDNSKNSNNNGDGVDGNDDVRDGSAGDAARDASRGVIARYARGRDYHKVMKRKLLELLRRIESDVQRELPAARAYVDTGPLLEREFARRAGLGWFGRNTMLIHPRRGSYFFLGSLLLELELEPDAPFAEEHCGTCSACVSACPTGALLGRDANGAPVMDATRCISYLTIEQRGPIPRELRPLIGNRIYGCDICQEVCPWNGPKFVQLTREQDLRPRERMSGPELIRLMGMSDEEWDHFSQGSPVRRAKYVGFLRNVAVALGNWGAEEALPVLARALASSEALVRGHAAWALGRIGTPQAQAAIEVRLEIEPDATVREELALALGR